MYNWALHILVNSNVFAVTFSEVYPSRWASKHLPIFSIQLWLDNSTLEIANKAVFISGIWGGFVKPWTLTLPSLVVNCRSPAVLCTYSILHLLGLSSYQIHRTSAPHISLSMSAWGQLDHPWRLNLQTRLTHLHLHQEILPTSCFRVQVELAALITASKSKKSQKYIAFFRSQNLKCRTNIDLVKTRFKQNQNW